MKTYYLRFGQTNPANYTGLSPTFTIFSNPQGFTGPVSPGITESPAASGLYYFGFTATTFAIAFKVDGGATLSSTDRYIAGILDPVQAVDEKLGWLSDSFGTTLTDPTTVMGYLKRNQEVAEGTAVYASATGTWTVLSRAFVSGVTLVPVALFSHLLTNNSGSVIKS